MSEPQRATRTQPHVRVMLVDDHEVVRQGLRSMINASGDLTVCAEAATTAEAIHAARAHVPHVVVMDLRLPDGSGVEACREIRTENDDIKVLILTSFTDDQALFDAIMAGASGYLLKQVRGTDLIDGIRRIASGESLLDPSVTSQVLERIRDPHAGEDPRLARLTPTERRILDHIADGETNRQIGEHLGLAEKTIKNYVSVILTKLDVNRRTEAAAYLFTNSNKGSH